MRERWVVNASPLILLAKIEQLDLLTLLADAYTIPESVVIEVCAGPEDDPARRILESTAMPTTAVAASPTIMAWDLGDGETAVLSYALTIPGWTAVIDDGAARRCARALGVPMLGTLGIILRARQEGFIVAAKPLLQKLKTTGIRLDDAVIREALKLTCDEDWE